MNSRKCLFCLSVTVKMRVFSPKNSQLLFEINNGVYSCRWTFQHDAKTSTHNLAFVRLKTWFFFQFLPAWTSWTPPPPTAPPLTTPTWSSSRSFPSLRSQRRTDRTSTGSLKQNELWNVSTRRIARLDDWHPCCYKGKFGIRSNFTETSSWDP